ncbi:unnamed protein product [Absidia cylindrospora]
MPRPRNNARRLKAMEAEFDMFLPPKTRKSYTRRSKEPEMVSSENRRIRGVEIVRQVPSGSAASRPDALVAPEFTHVADDGLDRGSGSYDDDDDDDNKLSSALPGLVHAYIASCARKTPDPVLPEDAPLIDDSSADHCNCGKHETKVIGCYYITGFFQRKLSFCRTCDGPNQPQALMKRHQLFAATPSYPRTAFSDFRNIVFLSSKWFLQMLESNE